MKQKAPYHLLTKWILICDNGSRFLFSSNIPLHSREQICCNIKLLHNRQSLRHIRGCQLHLVCLTQTTVVNRVSMAYHLPCSHKWHFSAQMWFSISPFLCLHNFHYAQKVVCYQWMHSIGADIRVCQLGNKADGISNSPWLYSC